MKKFGFGLEKILTLRAWDEKEARLALGRAVGVLTAVETALVQNEAERQNLRPEQFGKPDSISTLSAYSNYQIRLDAEKQTLLREKEAAEQSADAARQAWQEAAAQKKTLETLKDKQAKTYKKTVLYEEEKEADDMAQRKHNN
ncbi:MAG: flagellar export protein FliJ [Spirochaetaceae bacterium]|jgi:flagellar FliJ protein|nr:flagellar export protein FliJ [Spirochaetaceae bacterium]